MTRDCFSHAIPSQKAKYNCTECKYSCIQSINLKSHIKRHHPELYSQLLCSQCKFVSVNLDALRKHNQDHKLGLIQTEDSNDTEPDCAMLDVRNRQIGPSEVYSSVFCIWHHSDMFIWLLVIIRLLYTSWEYRLISTWPTIGHWRRDNTCPSLGRSTISELKRQFHSKISICEYFYEWIWNIQ